MRTLVTPIVLLVLALAAPPAASAAGIAGNWLTADKSGVVAIYPCDGGALCGRLIRVRMTPADRNPDALDLRNPDAALRHRKLCGLVMMWGLKPDGANHWSDGEIYDPKSGNTYSAEMTLKSAALLDLRGYVGTPLFGRTEEWTRFSGPVGSCR